jgi:hypothetical protein
VACALLGLRGADAISIGIEGMFLGYDRLHSPFREFVEGAKNVDAIDCASFEIPLHRL